MEFMMQPTKHYTTLNTPFSEKSTAQLVGWLFQQQSIQAAAASANLTLWHATFTGQIGDAKVYIDTIPGAAESMVYDLTCNGVSMLTGTLTVDENVTVKEFDLYSLIDPALNKFVPGDVIVVERTYTEGAGDTEVNTVVIEPTVAPYRR